MSNSVPLATKAHAAAEIHRICPICGFENSHLIRSLELVVPDNFCLQDSFTVNSCANCGAVFHNVRPQADRNTYYESYTGVDTSCYQVSDDQLHLNELTVSFLERAGLYSPNQNIVDVGCSFGVTLMALQRRGFENLYAIDPDRAAIRYLSSLGIHGRTGLATDSFPELENSFDLIILRHVLEHMDSPIFAISNVKQWLKPGGKIYIELPDLSRYQECGPFPGFFFEYEHINHISLLTLLNLMRSFTLVQYESTPQIYPCLRALFEVSELEKPLHFAATDALFVENFFSCPNDTGNAVLRRIARLGTEEIALWGVSTFVYRVLTHTPLRNCNIRYLVDSNPVRHGEKLLGLTVESPEKLLSFKGDIVICGENSAESIKKAILLLGLKNRVVHLMQNAAEYNENE